MILLKYAKLYHKEINWDKIEMPVDMKMTLKNRIKEWVVCGYSISGKDAINLTAIERAYLYEAQTVFFKEKMAALRMAILGSKDQAELADDCSWEVPAVEDDLIFEYLKETILCHG